jgi:threonine dehydrogenase-like Zn-dependent dehydrogenase
VDVDEKKLEQATTLSADETVNNRNSEEAAERIQKITGRRGAGTRLCGRAVDR